MTGLIRFCGILLVALVLAYFSDAAEPKVPAKIDYNRDVRPILSNNCSTCHGPGAIPDIVDFRGVVCFGMSGDGAPFCFDSRERGTEPRVIWWDDVYWRVVAPDFASFLPLFDLQDGSP